MKRFGCAAIALLCCSPVLGQTSSLGAGDGASEPVAPAREAPAVTGNPTIEGSSLIAVKEAEPKRFKVNDLVTIIVRERTLYEADGTANARRQADLESELDAFIKFTGGGVGASEFRRGHPNINYKSTFNQRNDAETEREDKLTSRVTGTIVDVKPNGNLVIEATGDLVHDDEVHTLKVTGVCRSIDVTPDNTVLSTQLANKTLAVSTKGSIRNATRPGWLGTIYDWIRPL